MNITNDVDKKETHIEKKTDSSLVLMTLIKYSAYVLIFFGMLYFLIHYVLPKF
jgi:hypothetical protein